MPEPEYHSYLGSNTSKEALKPERSILEEKGIDKEHV